MLNASRMMINLRNVTRAASGVFRAHADLYWDRGFKASAHDDSTRRGLDVP